jgi:hypothetical protein
VVTFIAGRGATGHFELDPVPTPKGVRDGPEIKLDGTERIRCGIGKTHDPVGDVGRPAARRDVGEAGMQSMYGTDACTYRRIGTGPTTSSSCDGKGRAAGS